MVASLWPSINKVALISPSGTTVPEARVECLERLKALGIEVVPGAHFDARKRYLGGSVEERLEDLYAAFARTDIDAVWCLRGGYGAAQLIEHIDWQQLKRAREIPLIGYSDITALLVAFQAQGLRAIHGCVATEVNKFDWEDNEFSTTTRWRSLASIEPTIQRHAGTLALNETPQAPISGRLTGGNLTVLASLCGTSAALTLESPSILLIEDIQEPFYSLERSFFQLLNSLDTTMIQAICLGEFSDCKGPRDAPELAPILREWTRPHDIPLLTGLAMGHAGNNLAFPMGAHAVLDDQGICWAAKA